MNQLTMLIIDDHELFRAGIELIIKQNFPSTEVHSHGGIGGALDAPGLNPNVVLLDLNLNGVSGKRALDMVRLQWADALIIIVTSEQNSSVLSEIREEGGILVVSKAEPPETLVSHLRHALTAACAGPGAQPMALTRRQIEVLHHLRQGHPNKTIARLMALSEFTVRGHVQQIIRITRASNRTHAVYLAEQAGLL